MIRQTTIVRQRLLNQQLARPSFQTPEAVVARLGAVQAQDYTGASWALGLRARNITADTVDGALNAGAILRTHVLRPTWHFLAAADIRWILALSAPRVHAANGFVYRFTELDARVLARSRRVIERALADADKTRDELKDVLARAGIKADRLRLAYVMMHAELEGVICSGERRGRQFTYALLDKRVRGTPTLDRDAALSMLATRYFTSHGPATLRDFAWWSGLTVKDVRRGVELAGTELESTTIDGFTCWFAPSTARLTRAPKSPAVYLLPNYDEYLIAYKDRGFVYGAVRTQRGLRPRDRFAHHVILDGELAGSWQRTLRPSSVRPSSVVIEIASHRTLTKRERDAIHEAAERYGRFVNLPVAVRL